MCMLACTAASAACTKEELELEEVEVSDALKKELLCPPASGTRKWIVMTSAAAQWHALIALYGSHRRAVNGTL